MDKYEIHNLAIAKILEEYSWESIEWMFKPQSQFELFCRFDLDGMKKVVSDWVAHQTDNGNFRLSRDIQPHYHVMLKVIELEEFYKKIKSTYEKNRHA